VSPRMMLVDRWIAARHTTRPPAHATHAANAASITKAEPEPAAPEPEPDTLEPAPM